MELQSITMPGDTEQEQRQAARVAFLQYRHAVRERHDKEDEQIMRGYRALSQGKQLIHLRDTIKAGGLGNDGRPRLAVMRADQKWCFFRRSWDGGFSFTNDGDAWRSRHQTRMRFDSTVLEIDKPAEAQALVPLIPPGLRPNIALSNFHTLWEAEWKRVPPRDPALLRHLGGDLFAVVAVWDLTELERAVLGGRFDS
jgi:hypothetical protein